MFIVCLHLPLLFTAKKYFLHSLEFIYVSTSICNIYKTNIFLKDDFFQSHVLFCRHKRFHLSINWSHPSYYVVNSFCQEWYRFSKSNTLFAESIHLFIVIKKLSISNAFIKLLNRKWDFRKILILKENLKYFLKNSIIIFNRKYPKSNSFLKFDFCNKFKVQTPYSSSTLRLYVS